MTSSDKAPAKGFFSAVAGDAFLFTAALFALVTALVGGIMSFGGMVGPDGPVGALGAVVSATGSFLMVVCVVAGPVVAWRLHGRDFSNNSIAGIAVGVVVSAVAVVGGSFALTGIAMGIGALTGNEFGGLIVVLAVLVVAALVIIVRLDIDAVRDMSPERNEHRRLDILRLASTGVLALFTAGIVVAVVMNPGGEIGEAVPFAIIAGALAGFVTAVADMWVRRAERKQMDAGAAVSA